MFGEQYIAEGADIFITIVAILIGFAAGLNVLDVRSTKKKEENSEE